MWVGSLGSSVSHPFAGPPPSTVRGGLVTLGTEWAAQSGPVRWPIIGLEILPLGSRPLLPYSHCSGFGPVFESPQHSIICRKLA
jgi:hypothetical protein